MSEYKDDSTFFIMGQKITIISDECGHGLNTVADMGNFFYHLGNEYPSISAAIFAWQEVYDKELTNQELHQVMIDNNIIESGEQNASQKENYQEVADKDIIEEIICQKGSQEDDKKVD